MRNQPTAIGHVNDLDFRGLDHLAMMLGSAMQGRRPPPPRRPYAVGDVRDIGKSMRFAVLRRDGYRCHYCGRSAEQIELHIDHVVPWAKGGRTVMSNLTAACVDCNRGKRASSAIDETLPAG